MQGNRIFLSIAAVLAGTVACAQGSYTALKFNTATSLYNYEMLPVHTQNYERQQVFEKACQSKAAMLQYVSQLRSRFTQLAGELPQRGKLSAQVVGKVKGIGFIVEKIVFQLRCADMGLTVRVQAQEVPNSWLSTALQS